MTRLPLIFACLFLTAAPALAQSGSPESQTYDPTYSGARNSAADQIRTLQQQSQVDKGFIKPTEVHVSIVQPPYMEGGQFGLQMAVPDVVSGCYKLSPLEYEANFVDPYFLDIKVKHFRRLAPENNNAACDTQNKMSTGMMVLSREDLQARGTKEIRFSTDAAKDTYTINFTDTGVQLIPQSMMVFKGRNLGGELKDRIVHNFAGDNVVALYVPMARASDDVENQLYSFATSRALSPTGKPPATSRTGAKIYYFFDQGGHIAGQIGEEGYGDLGRISVARPYDGQDGRVWTSVDLSVFVTRPGTEL